MAYRTVKGRFHLCYRNGKGAMRGSEPDGDSIWFEAAKPKLFEDVGGLSARFNKGRFLHLRFEGIEAFELDLQGERQRAKEAVGARGALLGMLGLGGVTFAPPAPKACLSRPRSSTGASASSCAARPRA